LATKLHVYRGQEVVVTYDLRRCIHAAECLRALPVVFDMRLRPWVQPNAAPADAIAEAVIRCPSGALHFERMDGGASEAPPSKNTIMVDPDGPLYVRGDIELATPEGTVLLDDTRVAFCRCGASQNKPFCDNSHLEAGFLDDGALGDNCVRVEEGIETGGRLRVVPSPNGSLKFYGDLELRSADGRITYSGNRVSLCRCGASKNPPFCDRSHRQIGFQGS
jgi:CDGSH-type Zn-finger protein/uncharacterized Fe-S cluster protein YjdI